MAILDTTEYLLIYRIYKQTVILKINLRLSFDIKHGILEFLRFGRNATTSFRKFTKQSEKINIESPIYSDNEKKMEKRSCFV